jgi:hypothetical protein
MTKSGRKRHSPEQSIKKLREADTMLAAWPGLTIFCEELARRSAIISNLWSKNRLSLRKHFGTSAGQVR